MKNIAFYLIFATFISVAFAQPSMHGQEIQEIEPLSSLAPPSSTDDQEDEPTPAPTEPRSVTGVVKSVIDTEGNEYLVMVIQPIELAVTSITETYTVEVPFTETTPSGEVTKTRLETKTRTTQKVAPTKKPAVMIPLLKAMPCYVLKDSSRTNTTELKVGQHLLVAGSTIDALQVSSEIRKAASKQVELTGIAPNLPEFIVALTDKPKSEQRKSLLDTLMNASPYQGETLFFSDLKLVDPQDKDGNKKSLFKSKRHAEVAWIKARQDFFANRFDTSEPTLNALIEMDSKDPLVHYLRGIIRFNRGDSDGASMDFANGAELEFENGQTTFMIRDLQRVQGVARQALEEYRSYYRTSRM